MLASTVNAAVETDLAAITAALATMTDAELRALAGATYVVPQPAPGLLAWLEQACDWEGNRRAGYDFELRPPEAAIPPEEDAISFDVVIALRDSFAKDSPAVRALFDALVDLLSGGGERKKH